MPPVAMRAFAMTYLELNKNIFSRDRQAILIEKRGSRV
jgi:hypothetical protein